MDRKIAVGLKVRIEDIDFMRKSLKKEKEGLEQRLKVMAEEERGKLKVDYEYSARVFVQEEAKWFSDIEPGDEYVVITATLTNKEILDDYVRVFGHMINPPKERMSSVTYYTKYGMLFHEGGGTCILKDKVPCSSEDWDNIKAGNVKKFLKRYDR